MTDTDDNEFYEKVGQEKSNGYDRLAEHFNEKGLSDAARYILQRVQARQPIPYAQLYYIGCDPLFEILSGIGYGNDTENLQFTYGKGDELHFKKSTRVHPQGDIG